MVCIFKVVFPPPLAPGDYDNTTVDVTFHSGDIELPAPIAIVNDIIVEDMEIFRLSLSSTDARAVTGPGSQVVILDDGDSEWKTTNLQLIMPYEA